MKLVAGDGIRAAGPHYTICDVLDLPLPAGAADRYRIGRSGHCTCTQGNGVLMRGLSAVTQRHGAGVRSLGQIAQRTGELCRRLTATPQCGGLAGTGLAQITNRRSVLCLGLGVTAYGNREVAACVCTEAGCNRAVGATGSGADRDACVLVGHLVAVRIHTSARVVAQCHAAAVVRFCVVAECGADAVAAILCGCPPTQSQGRRIDAVRGGLRDRLHRSQLPRHIACGLLHGREPGIGLEQLVASDGIGAAGTHHTIGDVLDLPRGLRVAHGHGIGRGGDRTSPQRNCVFVPCMCTVSKCQRIDARCPRKIAHCGCELRRCLCPSPQGRRLLGTCDTGFSEGGTQLLIGDGIGADRNGEIATRNCLVTHGNGAVRTTGSGPDRDSSRPAIDLVSCHIDAGARVIAERNARSVVAFGVVADCRACAIGGIRLCQCPLAKRQCCRIHPIVDRLRKGLGCKQLLAGNGIRACRTQARISHVDDSSLGRRVANGDRVRLGRFRVGADGGRSISQCLRMMTERNAAELCTRVSAQGDCSRVASGSRKCIPSDRDAGHTRRAFNCAGATTYCYGVLSVGASIVTDSSGADARRNRTRTQHRRVAALCLCLVANRYISIPFCDCFIPYQNTAFS